MAGLGPAARADVVATPSRPPNILFILVDQLRFPTVFPAGVRNVDQFFAKFMPNLYKRLWTQGIKFDQHFTAASACTPARGVLISGLYSQQSWLAVTILATPNPHVSLSPVLTRASPPYGKLLKAAGSQPPLHRQVARLDPAAERAQAGPDGVRLRRDDLPGPDR